MSTTSVRADTREPSGAPDDGQSGGKGGDAAFGTVAHAVLVLWSVMVIFPLLWTLLSSFKTSSEITSSPFKLPAKMQWDNFVRAWQNAGIGSSFVNTIVVVGSALVLVMLLGAMFAYVLAQFRFPARRFLYYLMLAGLTFPIPLAVVPLFFVLKNFGLLNTLPGLIISYVAFALPFTVFFLYAFYKALPGEMREAASLDGAGEWKTFFLVMLPMARPGMASVAIFNFLGLWNQYLIPLAINTKESNWVLSQRVASFVASTGYEIDYGALFAAVVITIAPVLVVYILLQRQLQGSVSTGAMK